MTPRHKFPATVRTDNPPASEALLDFVAARGFILATKRTRPLLLALVAEGKLEANGSRFTMKEKAE